MAKDKLKEAIGFRALKRVLQLFDTMSTSKSELCRNSINVADELQTLLLKWKHATGSTGDDSTMLVMIDFFVKESSPSDVLHTLVLWSSVSDLGDALFSRLDSLLRQGVRVSLKTELSGSLLGLKHARQGYTDVNRDILATIDGEAPKPSEGIWRQMSVGALAMDK